MPREIRTPEGVQTGYFRAYAMGRSGPLKPEERPDLPEGMSWVTFTNTEGEIYWVPRSTTRLKEDQEQAAKRDADWDSTLPERQAALEQARARGLGQTGADLQAQIDPYADIPWVGGEDAVFQAGASATVRAGPKLPRFPGVKPPNQETLARVGQRCTDPGEISLGRHGADLLKKFGVSVGWSANVCVNVNQAVKKAAGMAAEAVLDSGVRDQGRRMNEGRVQQINDAIKASTGQGGGGD